MFLVVGCHRQKSLDLVWLFISHTMVGMVPLVYASPVRKFFLTLRATRTSLPPVPACRAWTTQHRLPVGQSSRPTASGSSNAYRCARRMSQL